MIDFFLLLPPNSIINQIILEMKKTFLAAMALIVAFAFTACDKPEKTKEEMLTQKNGWILTAATSEPPYIMEGEDGEPTEHLRDLFKGYFFDWELDDVYFYETSGALKVDPGKLLPPAGKLGYDKVTTLGTWILKENDTKLITKVPSFYDKDPNGTWTMDEVIIKELTETTLKYEFFWSVAAKKKKKNPKSDDESYTFTLTFSKK